MKRAFLCLMVLLGVSGGIAFANGESVPHFMIGQVLELSGGGRNLSFTHRKVEPYQSNETMRDVYEYAGNVQKIYGGGGHDKEVIFIKGGKSASKPIAKNKVPREKDGLINAKNPVLVTSCSDWITFSLHESMTGIDYKMRLLDAKGRELASRTNEQSYEKSNIVKLPSSPKGSNYYVEFSQSASEILTDKNKKYYYVLLKVSPSSPSLSKSEINFAEGVIRDYMRANNIASYYDIDRSKAQNEEIDRIFFRIKMIEKAGLTETAQAYMKEHSLSYAGLTDEDVSAITKRGAHGSALGQYMQRNNKTYEDLTQEDITAARDEAMKNSDAAGEVVDTKPFFEAYMKEKHIASFGDLSDRDFEEIQRRIERHIVQQEKSSRKNSK